MYLEQFLKDTKSLQKYLPFVIGFLGFMAFNIGVSYIMNIDSASMIQKNIDTLGKNITFLTLIIPFLFFLGFLFLWWILIHKHTIKELTTARKKVDWNRILFAFGFWILLNILIVAVTIWMSPNDFEFQFNPQKFIPLLFIALIFIPIQTSFEEYFFRGYFMQFMALLSKNRGVALIVTSVIFGLMHLSNPEISDMGLAMMIFYIGSGFFLGIMTLMDDGLELALGFHAANNLLGALLVTSNGAVFQTDALFIFNGSTSINELLVQVFIIFPILLITFAKKYQWKNWKEKLFKSI